MAVRVARVDLFQVGLPLLEPWRTAFGEERVIETVLARIESEDGMDAWGESSPLAAPRYSPEWASGAFFALRDHLAPALVGRRIADGREIRDALAPFKGNYFAKAALDVAWHVLAARIAGEPLHTFLGGRRTRVEVGADFGVASALDELVSRIGVAVDAGYRRVKLKARPGWDVEVVARVRAEFPSLTFHIDCNSGYGLEHVDLFRELDEYGLAMIEQPLAHDDLIDHATLQAQIETPVCLDESIVSTERARKAIELGSCRYVNVKPGRVGGLATAVEIHDVCRDAGVPCWVGGMQESGIGSAVCVALATLDNFTYPADIFPFGRFYAEDLVEPTVQFERGADGVQYALADATGMPPRAPLPDLLEQFTIRSATVSVADGELSTSRQLPS